MEMAGIQFNRERIADIIKEIHEIKKESRDFIGDSSRMELSVVDNEIVLKLDTGEGTEAFPMNNTALRQFTSHVKFDARTWDRYNAIPQARELLAGLGTRGLRSVGSSHAVRTLRGKVRSFLSNSYRFIDNYDAFMIAAQEFERTKAEIIEARIHPDGDFFRMYAVAPGVIDEVDDANPTVKWAAEERIVPAVMIQNSETGKGRFQAAPCLFLMVCGNWNLWHEVLAQIHLGRKKEEEGWITDDTRRAEDQVTERKLRDIINNTLSQQKRGFFEKMVNSLRDAKTDEVSEPVKAVSAAVEMTGVAKEFQDSILAKFLGDKDLSRNGLVQAFTYVAHEAASDQAKNDLEDAGSLLWGSKVDSIMKHVPA